MSGSKNSGSAPRHLLRSPSSCSHSGEGFLGIDGKVIRVKGDKRCLLIGVDHPTQDLVHALVLDSETADGFARLATEARLDAGHALAGVVSDLGPGFAQSHRDHFGSVPFQACRVHFDRRLDQEIPKSLWSAKAPLYAELKERIREVLYASDYDQAVALLQALKHDRARFKGIGKVNMIRSLERTFDLFMAHHFTPGLPADNNVAENVIKQLNKKLRLMEGFESIESAERYVRLLVGCYRFKRFTDSQNGNNGKAPLELAGRGSCGTRLALVPDRSVTTNVPSLASLVMGRHKIPLQSASDHSKPEELSTRPR